MPVMLSSNRPLAPDVRTYSSCICTIYTHTHTHTRSHTNMFFICTPLMEHSLEPAAEIQIALDHFPMVYISICPSSSARLLLFQRLFPFPFLFLSFFPFFCSHCLMCFEPQRCLKCLYASMHTLNPFGSSLAFLCKIPPPIYCSACCLAVEAYGPQSA